jgi:hypothetical protein
MTLSLPAMVRSKSADITGSHYGYVDLLLQPKEVVRFAQHAQLGCGDFVKHSPGIETSTARSPARCWLAKHNSISRASTKRSQQLLCPVRHVSSYEFVRRVRHTSSIFHEPDVPVSAPACQLHATEFATTSLPYRVRDAA